MKLLMNVVLLFSVSMAFASDMSKLELNKDAYKKMPDGSSAYIGKCSTHQDYENKYFKVMKVVVPYFEPNYASREADTFKHVIGLDKELIAAVKSHLNFDSIAEVDDLTVEKIESLKFKNLDLFRLNIGVGGGNGMYVVFNKLVAKNEVKYELISSVMDGDVEYCDSKVWLK